jgi:hypothetical protein
MGSVSMYPWSWPDDDGLKNDENENGQDGDSERWAQTSEEGCAGSITNHEVFLIIFFLLVFFTFALNNTASLLLDHNNISPAYTSTDR